MTESLISVEGNLRLPTLRPLMDPSLKFGRRWSPAPPRLVRSRSEIALFGARLDTGYVATLRPPDEDSPYRAASLWGVFVKEEPAHGRLNLMESRDAPVDDPSADPIHLAIGAPVAAGGASRRFTIKPVAAAMAIASAALVVWLIFGIEPGSPGKAPPPAPAVEARMPAQEKMATPASSNRPDLFGHTAQTIAQTTATTTPAAATASPNLKPIAIATPPTAQVQTISGAARMQEEPVSATPKAQRESRDQAMRTSRTTSASDRFPAATGRAEKPQTAQRGTAMTATVKPAAARRDISRHKAWKHETAQRETTKSEAVSHHGSMKHKIVQRDAVTQETVKQARATPVDRNRDRLAKTRESLDPATLYDMLQHSPTLDSNAVPALRAASPQHSRG